MYIYRFIPEILFAIHIYLLNVQTSKNHLRNGTIKKKSPRKPNNILIRNDEFIYNAFHDNRVIRRIMLTYVEVIFNQTLFYICFDKTIITLFAVRIHTVWHEWKHPRTSNKLFCVRVFRCDLGANHRNQGKEGNV